MFYENHSRGVATYFSNLIDRQINLFCFHLIRPTFLNIFIYHFIFLSIYYIFLSAINELNPSNTFNYTEYFKVIDVPAAVVNQTSKNLSLSNAAAALNYVTSELNNHVFFDTLSIKDLIKSKPGFLLMSLLSFFLSCLYNFIFNLFGHRNILLERKQFPMIKSFVFWTKNLDQDWKYAEQLNQKLKRKYLYVYYQII